VFLVQVRLQAKISHFLKVNRKTHNLGEGELDLSKRDHPGVNKSVEPPLINLFLETSSFAPPFPIGMT